MKNKNRKTTTTNDAHAPHPGKGHDPRRDIAEAAYWMPYEVGEEDGAAGFDDQYAWGGRVTRQADAEAAARAVIRKVDDCEPLLDEVPMPQGAHVEGMLAELKDAYGAKAYRAYLKAEGISEQDLLEAFVIRWQEGYSAGHDDAARASAEAFLGL